MQVMLDDGENSDSSHHGYANQLQTQTEPVGGRLAGKLSLDVVFYQVQILLGEASGRIGCPDSDESAQSLGEARIDGRKSDGRQSLQFSGSVPVKMLKIEINEAEREQE